MSTITRRGLLTGLGAAAVTAGLGLSGCRSGGGGPEATDPGVLPSYVPYTGVEPTYPAEPGRTSAAFDAYPADPVRFAETAPGDGRPVSFIGPTSFALPPAMADNPFWQQMNQRVGSELQITLTPAGDYSAKFATTVAGRRLPDMFYVGAMPALPRFMASQAADLTDHLAGDAIRAYPGLANIPSDSWRQCMFDGRIRALPLNRGLVSLSTVLAREDLLQAEGASFTDAISFDALLELSRQLTGGNRWAWTVAPIDHLQQMLDLPGIWGLDDAGRLISTLRDERQQHALEAARRLVEAKVVNPDAAAASSSARKQWFGAGTAVFQPDSFIAWFSLYVQNASVEGLEIQALPIAGFDGGQGTQQLPNPNAGITAISAGAADRVPTLLKIADWLAAPFGTEEYLFNKYGIAGRNYTLSGTDPRPAQQADEVNIGSLYIADAARAIYAPGRPEAVKSAWDHQRAATAKAVANPVYGLSSDTADSKLNSLTGALESVQADIIYGRRPVSDWSAAVDSFWSGGGEQILAEYQADRDQQQGG